MLKFIKLTVIVLSFNIPISRAGDSLTVTTQKLTHLVNLELGGKASIVSFNYQNAVAFNNKWYLYSSVGVGTLRLFSLDTKFNPDLVFPFELEIRRKYNKWAPAIGLGTSIAGVSQLKGSNVVKKWSFNPFCKIGLTYQSKSKISYSLAYYLLQLQTKHPKNWAGISFNYEI